jgi:hypothetical protein
VHVVEAADFSGHQLNIVRISDQVEVLGASEAQT